MLTKISQKYHKSDKIKKIIRFIAEFVKRCLTIKTPIETASFQLIVKWKFKAIVCNYMYCNIINPCLIVMTLNPRHLLIFIYMQINFVIVQLFQFLKNKLKYKMLGSGSRLIFLPPTRKHGCVSSASSQTSVHRWS